MPDDVAVVVATSGSTGAAKHVLLTADALRASAAATERRLGGPGRWLLALPAEHVAGVQVVLRALLAGAAPVVQDLRDGFRPDGFARAVAELARGRASLHQPRPDPDRRGSWTPVRVTRADALASFDAVLVGGAALDPGLRRRAEEAGVRVVTTYGMSETCGGCVYDGVALDGVTVDIEAPDATGAGRIVLGGAVVAAGYLGPGRRRRRVRRTAGSAPATSAGSTTAGCTVLGRADDVINTGGEKVAPAAVERALLGVPGVAGRVRHRARPTPSGGRSWPRSSSPTPVADDDDAALRRARRIRPGGGPAGAAAGGADP